MALPPQSVNVNHERLHRNELLVALGAIAPLGDREAAGPVQYREAVVPGVGLGGDTLLACGDEGAHAEIGPPPRRRRAAPPRRANAARRSARESGTRIRGAPASSPSAAGPASRP